MVYRSVVEVVSLEKSFFNGNYNITVVTLY